MRKNILLKSTFRQPVRVLLLILLLTAVSFAFFSELLQYRVLDDISGQIASFYQPSGGILGRVGKTKPPFMQDLQPAYDLIKEDSSIRFTEDAPYPDGGYYTGLLSDYYNLNYVADAVNPQDAMQRIYFRGTVKVAFPLRLEFILDEVYLGRSFMIPHNKEIKIYTSWYSQAQQEEIASSLTPGQSCLVCCWAQNELAVTSSHYLYNLLPLDGKDTFFYPMEEGDRPEDLPVEGLSENLNILRHNLSAVEVRPQHDMTGHFWRDKQWVLTSGRMLSKEDDDTGASVCVLREGFAKAYKLSVGDTIDLTLTDAPLELAFNSEVPAYNEAPGSLTVVGIVKSLDRAQKTSDTSRIYVPASLIPEDWVPVAFDYQPYFSFSLNSPDDRLPFLNTYESSVKNIGDHMSLRIPDLGWESYRDTTASLSRSNKIAVILFAIVLFMVSFLVLFFYLFLRRKDIARMRMFGISRLKVTATGLVLPGFISIIGFGVGGILAWFYGMKQVQITALSALEASAAASGLKTGITREIALSVTPPAMFLTALTVWILFLILSLIFLLFVLKRPILEQLQDDSASRIKQNRTHSVQKNASGQASASAAPFVLPKQPKPLPPYNPGAGKRIPFRVLAAFYHRTCLRTFSRSLLILLLTAAFTAAAGFLHGNITANRQNIDAMYRSIEVTGEIQALSGGYGYSWGAFINEHIVETLYRLEDEGWITQVHTSGGGGMQLSPDRRFFSSTSFRAPESPDYFLDVPDSLPDGLSLDDLWENGGFIFLSRSVCEQMGAKPGSEITCYLSFEENKSALADTYVLAGTFPDNEDYGAVICLKDMLRLVDEAHQRDPKFLAGGTPEVSARYAAASFTINPQHNYELEEIQRKIETEFAGSSVELNLSLDDAALTQAIRPLEESIRILEILFPAVILVEFLAGMGLTVLMILLSKKDLAVQRVLGIPGHRVIFAASSAQMVLVLAGLVIGLILTFAMASEGFRYSLSLLLAGIHFILCLLAALISCIAATWHNPLELLQVKM